MTDKRIAELRMVYKYQPITPKVFNKKMGTEDSDIKQLHEEGLVIWSPYGYWLTSNAFDDMKAALGGEDEV